METSDFINNFINEEEDEITTHVDPTTVRAKHSALSAEDEIEDLKKLVFVLWEVMKEKGYKAEDLNRMSAKVDSILKRGQQDFNNPVYCPECSKPMQRVDSLKCACLYCNSILYMHAYAKYNVIVDGEYNPDVQIDAYAPKSASQSKASQAPEEKPYDLDADLNFDDL